MPPQRQTPNAAAIHSARFGIRSPTRVPRPTPRAARPRPIAVESSRSSRYVARRRALMNASLDGYRAAAASSSAARVWRSAPSLILVESQTEGVVRRDDLREVVLVETLVDAPLPATARPRVQVPTTDDDVVAVVHADARMDIALARGSVTVERDHDVRHLV